MKQEDTPVIEKNVPIPKPHYKTGSYKWKCIKLMTTMDIGDSIKVENRSLAQVKYTWLWRASRHLGLDQNAFKIKSIDKRNHRIWRIK
jgi:hypothetical protein